jgi:flagellar motor component MotA
MNHAEFNENYYQIVERALRFNDKARREGLLSLEDLIDSKKADERDIFEYGLRFAVDGVDAEGIDIILSNIVNQDQDEQSRLLKTIQKEAVLSIQAGVNGRIMFAVLNSLTGLSLNEDKMKARLDEFYW